jgi:LEA14-like dessication related protein
VILSIPKEDNHFINVKVINMKIITTLLLGFVLIFSACRTTSNVSEPEFRDLGDVRVIEVGLLKTTAGADMIYYNPNNFGIQLSAARGDVYVDNAYFGSFQLNESVHVKKRAEFVLPVTLKIDNINAIKNQRDIYKKKEALVRIEGRAFVKKSGLSKEIPIRYEQMQNLDRLRAIVSR